MFIQRTTAKSLLRKVRMTALAATLMTVAVSTIPVQSAAAAQSAKTLGNQAQQSSPEPSIRGGWTGVWPTSKGVEYWMSSDLSTAVADALSKGKLSDVLGLIPGGALVGDVLEQLTAKKIREVNSLNTGVIVLVPWVGFPSVRAQ